MAFPGTGLPRFRAPSALDRILRFGLLPLAAGIFALHLVALVRTGLVEPDFFVVGTGIEGIAPEVAGFRLGLRGPRSPVQLGDRLLRVGETDLRGRGHLGVDAAVIEAAGGAGTTRLAFEREGVMHEEDLVLTGHVPPWSRTPALLGMLVVGAAILLRAPPGAHTRLISAAFLLGVIFQAQYHGLSPGGTVASKLGFYVLGAVVPAMLLYWAVRFPPENALAPAWLRRAPLAFSAAFLVLRGGMVAGGPIPARDVPLLITWVNGAGFAAILGALIWNYARALPVGRRRIRWVLLGCSIGLVPSITHVFTFTETGLAWYPWIEPWTHVAFVLAPLGILLAVARQSLFDVDRLLGAATTATVVGAVVLFGTITVLEPMETALAAVLGLDVRVGRAILAMILVASAVSLFRLARPWIDRVVAPERAETRERATRSLLEPMPANSGPAFYEIAGSRLATVFGCDGHVVVRPGDPLWTALRGIDTPTAVEDEPRDGNTDVRRALRTVACAAVVPLVDGPEQGAVICLPSKRSGDVFTASDLAWAAAIAEKTLRERIGAAERQLRRFVPLRVADAIRHGAPLDAIETRATVVFADLRKFTSFAAERSPREVFDALGHFVEHATRILEAHGGLVVELRGDAILCIFQAGEGAAGAAVRAARELVDARHAKHPEADGNDGARGPAVMPVGVGIATGHVFVGAVPAQSRALWSVIGDTANRAARLQGLTRSLGAGVVIDAATHADAGDAVVLDFRRKSGVRLDGTPERIDVYWLPTGGDRMEEETFDLASGGS